MSDFCTHVDWIELAVELLGIAHANCINYMPVIGVLTAHCSSIS